MIAYILRCSDGYKLFVDPISHWAVIARIKKMKKGEFCFFEFSDSKTGEFNCLINSSTIEYSVGGPTPPKNTLELTSISKIIHE